MYMKTGGRYTSGKKLEEVEKALEVLLKQNDCNDILHGQDPLGADHVALMIRECRATSSLLQRVFRPFLPLSDKEKNQLTVLDFEADLWKSFSLQGAIVSDEILKECQRRLHLAKKAANEPENTEVTELSRILKILDTIHRSRKSASSINHHHISDKYWEPKTPIPSEQFRRKLSPDFRTSFWSFIVGNNAYPHAMLKGCINDAKSVQNHLEEYLGVSPDRIRCLENATRKQMIAGLYDLRDNKAINPGDNILIHFSGHGTTYDPSTCFETFAAQAGSIEAICPIDRGEDVPDISDRELNRILNEILKVRKVNITVFLDCCHGGGVARSLDSATRAVSPLRTSQQTSGLSAMLKVADENPRRGADTPRTYCEDWLSQCDGFVQLAGCQDFQIAMEGSFKLRPNSKLKPAGQPSQVHGRIGNTDSRNASLGTRGALASNVQGPVKPKPNDTPLERQYGVFTWALLNVLKSNVGQTGTYEQVIQCIGRLSHSQDPVVIGRKDSRLWFRD